MTVSAVGKECVETDRAYLAGLIDGDGAIMALIEKHNEKKFHFRVRVEVKVTQKNRKDVLFLPALSGCGNIRPNRTTWEWITRDQKQILRVLDMIRPYSKMKTRQIDIATKIIRTSVKDRRDLLEVARLADALSRFNVRSNNRRKNHAIMIKTHFSSND
jgi:LAGLIDADG endonuclease